MIIKTKLSWEGPSLPNRTVLVGYYDNNEPWDYIKTVYLKKGMAERMINALQKADMPNLQMGWQGDHIMLSHHKEYRLISSETITYLDEEVSVYPFPSAFIVTQSRWVNWERYVDRSCFTWQDIYQAVLDGLREGLAAGREGHDNIQGQTPKEYAWSYLEDHPGN